MLRQLNGTQGMAFETCDFFIISGVGKKKLINALIQLITLDIQGHTLQCIVMHQVFQKGENNQSHYQSLANFLLKQILTLLCTAQNFLLLKCALLHFCDISCALFNSQRQQLSHCPAKEQLRNSHKKVAQWLCGDTGGSRVI